MLRRFVTGISDYIYLVMSGPFQVDVDEEDNGWNLDGIPMNQSMRPDTPPSSPRTGPQITSPSVKTAPTSNETPVKAFHKASSAPSRETPVKGSSSRGRSIPCSGSGHFPGIPRSDSGHFPGIPRSGSGHFPGIPRSGSGHFPGIPRSDSGHIPGTPPTHLSTGSMPSYDGSPPTPPPRGIDIPVSNTPATSSDSASNTIRPDGRRFEAFDTTLDNCTTSVKCTDPPRTSSHCYPRAIPSPKASQQAVMTPDQAHREIDSIQQSVQMLNAALDHGDFEQCPDSLNTIGNEISVAISGLETILHKSQVSSAACSRSPLHRHNTYPRMNAEATRGSPCRTQPAISRQSLVLDVPSYAFQIIRLGLEDGDERWMAIAERHGLSPKLIRDIQRKGEQSGMKNTPVKMLLETPEMDNYKMADLIADLEDIEKKSLIETLQPHME